MSENLNQINYIEIVLNGYCLNDTELESIRHEVNILKDNYDADPEYIEKQLSYLYRIVGLSDENSTYQNNN